MASKSTAKGNRKKGTSKRSATAKSSGTRGNARKSPAQRSNGRGRERGMNGAAQMDAIQLIERDHEQLRRVLKDLTGTSERSAKKRGALVSQVGEMVRTHARIEEEIFYPAYHEACKNHDDEELFFEAAEEHGLVDIVLPQLEGTGVDDDEFGARAKVLCDLIEHHAEEEETEMLPRAKKLLGRERLVELGEQMAARKEELSGGQGLTGLVTRAGRKLAEFGGLRRAS